ncbi:hypothetical protein BT93_K2210 [Corymbia citriodora subsp. variegata]|nr:hypothetical protein BT93_K2210 [Corymbia citriodora subsp. variegata]
MPLLSNFVGVGHSNIWSNPARCNQLPLSVYYFYVLFQPSLAGTTLPLPSRSTLIYKYGHNRSNYLPSTPNHNYLWSRDSHLGHCCHHDDRQLTSTLENLTREK